MANLIRRGSPSAVLSPRLPDPFEMMRDLMRWDPFAEFSSPSGELAFTPSFEVKETKDAYLFKADLPGIAEGDLDIGLTGNRLTVSGKREEEKKEGDDRYYAYERSYGSFSRSFTLPEGVDIDHAEAGLSRGVLTVSIPKKPEVKPKKIEVKRLAAKGEKGQA